MKLTILCVDDREDELRGYERELGEEYTILKAMTSEEALQFLQSQTCIDAVLMDKQLDREDGLEVTKRFRELGIKHPIVVVTRDSVPDFTRKDARSYWGAQDYVQKDPTIYRSILTEILQGRSSG